MEKFRRFLLKHPIAFCLWRMLLTLVGRVVLFWRRPKMTEAMIDRCYSILSSYSFAIIGVGSRRFATGLFLPRGRYDVEHTAIYIGNGLVVEAVAPRIRVISLRRFLKQYDNVAIGICRVCDWFEAIDRAMQSVDRPYDVLFADGRRVMYCHELGAECLEAAGRHPKKSGEYWLFDDLAAACDKVVEVKP